MQTRFFSILLLVFGLWSFGTAAPSTFPPSGICLACDIASGLNVTDNAGGSATLNWAAVSGATSYEVEAQDEQNNPSTFHIETTVTGNSYVLTGLQAGVLYKFKVRTHCGGDKSDWSEWFFFTASGGNGGGTGGGGNGGGSGDCAIPSGLTASVSGGTATLNWAAVQGAVKYYIEVEDEQNNPSTFHLEDSTTSTTYALPGLQAGVLYKFKVRARCSSGQSDWSAWLFFNGSGGGNGGGGTGGDCVAPAGLTAALSGTSATLKWNGVSGAVQYDIEIEDEQNVPSNFHLEVSSVDTFYVVTGLQSGVLYKFKVRTRCAAGAQSDWSAWQYFNGTLGGPPGGGGTGGCAKPTNQFAVNITSNSALLTWDSVPGVISYSLEVERIQQGANPFQITTTVTTNSYLLTGLSPNTRYKFKVRANCSATTHSKWTGWRKFKTAANLVGNDDSALKSATAEDRSSLTDVASATLRVWPNPAAHTTNVQIDGLGAQTATLRLYDLNGQLLLQQNIAPEQGSWNGQIQLSDLPNGIYLLHIGNEQQMQVRKLVVNKW